MQRLTPFTPIVLLALTTPAAEAQEPRAPSPMALPDAVRLALDHDPMLRATAASRDAADAAVGEARAAWLPTVALTASATQFEEPMLVNPIHDFQPGQTPFFDETLIQFGGTIHYRLFAGGARPARIRSARARAGTADAALAAAEQGLVARVAAAYLRVLTGRALRSAHDQRLAALAADLSRVRQRRETGQAADVDVLRVEAAHAGAQADRVRSATSLALAEHDLARLTGTPVDAARAERLRAVSLRDTELPARETLLAQAVAANPGIEQARGEQAVADALRAVARSGRWPALDLVGGYLDRGGADGHFLAEWNVGVQFSYPIFTGGAVSRSITRADAEGRAAAERLRATETEIAHEVDRAQLAVEEARARVASLATAVARFTEVVRIELLRLEAGTGTQTDYLNAEADLLEVRAGLVEARHAEILWRVAIAQATGRLDLTWLEQHLETQP